MLGSSHDANVDATSRAQSGVGEGSESTAGFAAGATIGRYVLLSQVGAGAMGMVFAAYDPQLDRKVALKLLRPRGGSLSRSQKRLHREAQALAKLDHPNVVSVHDVGVHEEQVFVAMEFVGGRNLAEWMESVPESAAVVSPDVLVGEDGAPRVWPWREVLEVFTRAGEGLAAAHEAGLVHRDFKPENVMLSEDGRVRVMDFGLVRVEDGETTEAVDPDASATSLTQTGSMMGTPAYMALEQFGAEPVDARSDQFAFCVALYEALYGERPFQGETVGELVNALDNGVVRGAPPGIPVPAWVRAVIVQGLAKEPGERFESMQHLLDALAADPVARRRRLLARFAVAAAFVGGSWGVLSLSGEVAERDAVIEEQAGTLELQNAELVQQLAVQRGLRARALVGMGREAEALLLGVQAVGTYADAWGEAPGEAVTGLEQVLAHEPVVMQARHVLRGHEDYVSCLAYSPDGRWLATGSYDGSARLWDSARGQPGRTLAGDAGQIWTLAFSPDGTRLATATMEGRAQLWNVASGERLATLGGSEGALSSLAFSPDGTRLATAGQGAEVRIWEVPAGTLSSTLSADAQGVVYDLAYSPDGARLVTVGADAAGKVWDVSTGQRVASMLGHEQEITVVAIAPDGTQVATASDDGTARTWALETGEPVAVLPGHRDRVKDLAYSADGARLATVSWDATGRIFDPASGKPLAVLASDREGSGIDSVAYARDGSSVAMGSYDGNVSVWSPEHGRQKSQLRGHGADVWSLAFAPDGRHLATASVDRTARIWDLDHVEITVLEGPYADVRRFAYSTDHRRLATVSSDGRLRLWNNETGTVLHTLDEAESHGGVFMAFVPDTPELVVAHAGRMRVWDAETGQLRSTTDVVPHIRDLRFSPSGTQLVVVGEADVTIYDAHTRGPLTQIESRVRTRSLLFSPDDTQLAIEAGSSMVQLRDTQTGALRAELPLPSEVPQGRRFGVVFSPDGTELVAAGERGDLQLWDAHTLVPRVTLAGSQPVQYLAFSPDGSEVAGGHHVLGVWVWDVETGAVLRRIGPDLHQPRMVHLGYSPDGRWLAIAGLEVVRIFDRKSGALVTYIDHPGVVRRFVFSPDGARLTTRSNDALHVWDTATGDNLTRERIGMVKEGGGVLWPVPPAELTRIGCERLRVFRRHYPEAAEICDPLLDG
ncbi:MAG: protein kinase [Myxococcota bacterium]